MPRGSITVDVKAPCDVVFDVLHDYAQRLRWDTMLSEARLVGGASRADVGVRSLCVGTCARRVAAVVDAVVSRMMARETRARLLALRDYIEHGGD